MKKQSRFSKWTLSFGALGAIIGGILAQIGDINLFAILGTLSGALLIIIINFIYVKSKSNKTPEYDERTLTNIRTFYFYAMGLFFSASFIILGALLSINITYISTLTLFIILLFYFVISGIIVIIISRK